MVTFTATSNKLETEKVVRLLEPENRNIFAAINQVSAARLQLLQVSQAVLPAAANGEN